MLHALRFLAAEEMYYIEIYKPHHYIFIAHTVRYKGHFELL
jgi:hypothetical protein